MKKLIPILITLFPLCGFSQIVYEHTYNENSLELIRTGPNEYYYVEYVYPPVSTFTIYNMNHSVAKAVTTLDIPPGFSIYGSFKYISKTLFNTDPNNFEFILALKNGTQYMLRIYHEDGTMLQDISPAYYAIVYNAGSNGSKLVAVIDPSTGGNEVYSLPGTVFSVPNGSSVGVADTEPEEQFKSAFPNPSNQTISLPCELSAGEKSGELIVLNNLGQVVQRFDVDGKFKDILFDCSLYPAGQYFYFVQSEKHQSKANNFVIVK